MAVTGPHTYTCDGCFEELDGNGMIVLLDREKGDLVHFHGYDHVAAWAERRHAEHTEMLARAEAETAERIRREDLAALNVGAEA